MPKIVQYNLPPGGTVVDLADNTSEALDIESGSVDYITISTVDGSEQINFNAAQVGTNDLVLTQARELKFSASGTALMNGEDPSATNPNFCPRNNDQDTGIGSNAADELSLIAGGQEGIRITESGAAITAEIKGKAIITDPSGPSGNVGQVGTSADTLVIDGAHDGGLTIVGETADPMRLFFVADDYDQRAGILAKAKGSSGDSSTRYLDLLAGGSSRMIINQDDITLKEPTTVEHATLSTIGALGTALTSGTVSTSGSSTALNGSGTVFTTDFHVGAAIKVGSVITTVTAITDDNNLTLEDAIDTSVTGTTCTRDGGELFAVKTGDSKTLFSVQPTGVIGAGANANSDSGVYNNIGIGDPTMFDKLTTGNALLVVGNQAGDYDFTTANSLIGIGYGAVANSTTSQNLVAIGAYSADTSTNIRESVIIGGGAGRSSGNDSVHIGHGAGKYCTGTKNVSIGREALQASGAAAQSVAVGYHALEEATGSWNVGVGYTAGDSIVGGQGNVMLGHGTDNGAGSNYGVAIGISSVCNGHRENLIGASISSYGANTTTIGNDEQNFIVNEGVGTCSIGALDRPFGGLMTMARKILSIERSLGQVNTTDTGKIDQLTAFGGVSAVKIPAYSIITFCSLTMTDASGASTHNAMVATSTTSGTSDGTALAGTVVEIIGAGAAGTRSTDTTGSATDIDLKAAPGKTWYNDSKFHVGSSDVYLYVATAGTSNSGSAGTCKAILTVEYIGVD